MEHINKIELKGRVGNIRLNTVNETQVANFSLVTEYFYKNKENEMVAETTWHSIVAWEGKDMPDFSKISKGTTLHIFGRTRLSKFTTTEGVEKQYSEVLANKVQIISGAESEI